MGWSYTIDALAVALEAQRPGDATRFSRVCTDTRTLKEGDVFFALSGERFDGEEFVSEAFDKGAVAAVTREPHVGEMCLVVPDTLKALQQFGKWHRQRHPVPLLAITGSCGKTTSKDLTAAVLAEKYTVVKTEGNLNNEIGCPQSLLGIGDDTEFAVMEMGANHRGEIAALCALAMPTESAITMIGPAHLEGFGSIEDVARAKGEIIEGLPQDGTFYVNADDPRCVTLSESFEGKRVFFGSEGDVTLKSWSTAPDGELLLQIEPTGELKLPIHSRTHATNVLLAIAVGLEHGITEFEEALRTACAQAVRFRIHQIGPLTIIDDSYNSNPASVRAAFEALANRPATGHRIAVLGEMLELGAESRELHREVGRWAGEYGLTHVLARGPHAEAVVEGARSAGLPYAKAFEEYEAIANAIHEIAVPGDTLLVKGSRGMRMERVIDELAKRYGLSQNVNA